MSEAPDETMLKQLRALEVKMGLVLTLVCGVHCGQSSVDIWSWLSQFKASVWAVINEQPLADMSGAYTDSNADDTIRQ